MRALARFTAASVSLMLIMIAIGFASAADAASFFYRVDDATIVGNQPGFVADDFDDGSVSPWVPLGTVSESGGFLELATPGVMEGPGEVTPTFGQEVSGVHRAGSWTVADGAGSFDFISRWEQTTPGVDQWMGITFTTALSDGTWEQVLLQFGNSSQEMNAAFGAPDAPAGLYFTLASWIEEDDGGMCCGPAISGGPQQLHSVPVSSVTGDVVFRLSFDDVANTFSGQVSIDGGATFTTIGSVASQFSGSGVLGVDARQLYPVPEPAALGILGAGALALLHRTRRR